MVERARVFTYWMSSDDDMPLVSVLRHRCDDVCGEHDICPMISSWRDVTLTAYQFRSFDVDYSQPIRLMTFDRNAGVGGEITRGALLSSGDKIVAVLVVTDD